MNKCVAPHPEYDGCHQHQQPRQSEGDARTKFVSSHIKGPVQILTFPTTDVWYEKCCEERAEINHKVKRLKHFLHKMPIPFSELVADVRGNAWLDPARTDRDECQSDPHSAERAFGDG